MASGIRREHATPSRNLAHVSASTLAAHARLLHELARVTLHRASIETFS
jgi:hypothetical protein